MFPIVLVLKECLHFRFGRLEHDGLEVLGVIHQPKKLSTSAIDTHLLFVINGLNLVLRSK